MLTEELLNRGQIVKVIVRSPDKLPTAIRNHNNLSVIQASVLDLSDAELAQHVKGCDAVASCLGHNLNLKGIYGQPRKLVTDATRRLCEAIKANRPEKLSKFVLMNTTGNSNHILVKGWPMQFFLVAGALAWLMTAVSSTWFLIPILILFLNGFLFAYSVFSGNWAQWVFLWPLELFILAGAPWYTISLAQGEQQVENKSRTLGRRISRYGLSAAIVCILMALIWS